jgi:hypothetical protein
MWHASCMQYAWELWHRQGEYPPGCAAFAFAAAAAAAGFRAQRPETTSGGKPGPGGHTTARMRAGIGYSPTEQVKILQFQDSWHSSLNSDSYIDQAPWCRSYVDTWGCRPVSLASFLQ